MKPEGRKVVKFPCKRDVHPQKGWINWWEGMADLMCRSTRKLRLRKEINEQIIE